MAKRKDNIIWISPPLHNGLFLFLCAVCVGCPHSPASPNWLTFPAEASNIFFDYVQIAKWNERKTRCRVERGTIYLIQRSFNIRFNWEGKTFMQLIKIMWQLSFFPLESSCF